MSITVHILITDDHEGTRADAFTTESDRALISWVGSDAKEWAQSELADNLYEYVSSRYDHGRKICTDEQTLENDISQAPRTNAAWSFCKSIPGAFGAFYDPIDVMTIMGGWAVEGDHSDTSHWFEAGNDEDTAAILAWCEKEGSRIERQISDLVCNTMPTRKEAFEALAMKRSAPVIPLIL